MTSVGEVMKVKADNTGVFVLPREPKIGDVIHDTGFMSLGTMEISSVFDNNGEHRFRAKLLKAYSNNGECVFKFRVSA
jgi:hypothetical protein